MIAAIALSVPASGEELRFQCPERYLTRVTELIEVPPEWRGAVAAIRPELPLSGGGVVGGSPRLYPPAELHGDTLARNGRAETRYPVDAEGETWAYCAYGRGGEVQLSRRVDGQERRECTVISSNAKSSRSPQVEITCR